MWYLVYLRKLLGYFCSHFWKELTVIHQVKCFLSVSWKRNWQLEIIGCWRVWCRGLMQKRKPSGGKIGILWIPSMNANEWASPFIAHSLQRVYVKYHCIVSYIFSVTYLLFPHLIYPSTCLLCKVTGRLRNDEVFCHFSISVKAIKLFLYSIDPESVS